MENPDFSDFNALDSLYIFTRYICTASLHHCIHHGFLSGFPNRDVALLLQGLPRRERSSHNDRHQGAERLGPPWPTMTHLMGAKLLRCSIQTPWSRIACIWASVPYPWHWKCNLNPKKTMHPASAIQKCISGPLMTNGYVHKISQVYNWWLFWSQTGRWKWSVCGSYRWWSTKNKQTPFNWGPLGRSASTRIQNQS